jgi:hypothetical protein
MEALMPVMTARSANRRAPIICCLPDKPPAAGSDLTVTVLDPPYFDTDGGMARATLAKGGNQLRPEQARQL